LASSAVESDWALAYVGRANISATVRTMIRSGRVIDVLAVSNHATHAWILDP